MHADTSCLHRRRVVGGLADADQVGDIVGFHVGDVLWEGGVSRCVHEEEAEFAIDDEGGLTGQHGRGPANCFEGRGMRQGAAQRRALGVHLSKTWLRGWLEEEGLSLSACV